MEDGQAYQSAFTVCFRLVDIPNDDGDPDNAKDDVGDIGIDVHVMDDRFPLRADSRAQVIRTVFQMTVPTVVNRRKRPKFMLAIPAGNEIKHSGSTARSGRRKPSRSHSGRTTNPLCGYQHV